MQEEIKELVAETFLKNAPVIPVSAVTGEGLGNLRTELANLYLQLKPHQYEKPFDLWWIVLLPSEVLVQSVLVLCWMAS